MSLKKISNYSEFVSLNYCSLTFAIAEKNISYSGIKGKNENCYPKNPIFSNLVSGY